jgi:hypothetical protein
MSTFVKRAVLKREGRDEPIPCQTERTSLGMRAWWLADRMAPDQEMKYHLAPSSLRRPPMRVAFEPGPFGWRVYVRKVPVAEIFCPEFGAPQASLLPHLEKNGENPAQHPMSRANISQVTEGCHRRRLRPIHTHAGWVFGDVAAEYGWVDRWGIIHARERHHWRIFDGSSIHTLVDWTIVWEAISGRIETEAPGVVLDWRVRHCDYWINETGYRDHDLIRSPSMAAFGVRAADSAGAVLMGDSWNTPTGWQFHEDDIGTSLRTVILSNQHVVPLGECRSVRIRLLRLNEHTFSKLQTRFIDMTVPPETAVQNS